MIRTATRRTALTPQAKARQLKLLQATAERITRDHYITFIAGITPKVVVFNRSTLKEKRLDLVQATAVSECCLRWQIGLYALCRSEQGQDYLKAEVVSLDRPVRQREIHQELTQMHMAFMRESVNRKHLLTLAWCATTGEPPSNEQFDAMATKLGAWQQLDVAEDIPGGGMGVVEMMAR